MNTSHFVIRFLIRLLVLGITAVLYSCSSNDKDVRYALSVAGENREELEKVLQRYKSEGDIEKYRAACFLIKNMPYHYWYEGPQIDCGYGFFAAVRNSPERSVDEIRDSIANRIHGYTNNTVKFDILELDSTFICHSIDAAFKQRREKPWGSYTISRHSVSMYFLTELGMSGRRCGKMNMRNTSGSPFLINLTQ